MKKMCTIVFAGRRDNYELAKAFRDAGWATTLVTDFVGPAWLQRLPFPRRVRDSLRKRRMGLEGIEVVTPASVALSSITMAALARDTPVWTAERLGIEAARVANRRGGLLVSYSTYAYEALARARPEVGKILFQMHPHADACLGVLRKFEGEVGSQPKLDWELRLSQRSLARYRFEWRHADGILTASSYTRRTLVEVGASVEKIRTVPYGAQAPCAARTSTWPGAKIKLLFVGAFIRRKGTLEVARLAREFGERVEVHACGRGLQDPMSHEAFAAAGVNVHWNASDQELGQLRADCDLFVFPSYLEGFAHVILESMLAGLPVLSTSRTCAPDLVIPGQHGWVVEAGDWPALREVVQRCLENPAKLRAMRTAVRVRAGEFTWQRFRQQAVQAVEELLEH